MVLFPPRGGGANTCGCSATFIEIKALPKYTCYLLGQCSNTSARDGVHALGVMLVCATQGQMHPSHVKRATLATDLLHTP